MSILTTNAGVLVGNKPSVLDLVKLRGATDSPLFSMIKSGSASNIIHSWLTDTLRAYGDNAQVEISDTQDYAAGSKVLLSNTMQIFTTDVKVSDSQQATSTYGAKSLQHELMKGAKEHSMDIEFAMLGLGNASIFSDYTARIANTTAGRMAGIPNYIPDANSLNTSGSGAARVGGADTTLTYDLFQSLLEPIWQQGGEATKVYTGPTLKKVINGFDSGNTVVNRVMNDTNNYDARITKVSTDFGIVDVCLHRYFITANATGAAGTGTGNMDGVLLAGDFTTCTTRNLISTKLEEVSNSDTATVKRYYTEACIEILNPDLVSIGMNYTA